MPYQFPPDLDEKIKEQLASGDYDSEDYDSEDDVLRDAFEALKLRDD